MGDEAEQVKRKEKKRVSYILGSAQRLKTGVGMEELLENMTAEKQGVQLFKQREA